MTFNEIDKRKTYDFQYYKDGYLYKITRSKINNFKGDFNADYIDVYFKGEKIFTI